MFNIIKSKQVIAVSLLMLAVLVLSHLRSDGLPLRYDWDWPLLDMRNLWREFGDFRAGNPFDFASKNGLILLAPLGLFRPEFSFALFLILLHALAAAGFFLFAKSQGVNRLAATISALVYAFNPYLFVRTIVGFRWSLLAFAALPFFLHLYFNIKKKNWRHYLGLGFLYSLVFAQVQAGLLLTLFLMINLLVAAGRRRERFFNLIFSWSALVLFLLPWFVLSLSYDQGAEQIRAVAVTTLEYMRMMPHSAGNFLNFSDHQITHNFFYALSHDPRYLFGLAVFWLAALFGLGNRPRRELALTSILTLISVAPFPKGPSGPLGPIFVALFERIPALGIFREIYHLQFIVAAAAIILFAFGLDYLFACLSAFSLRPLASGLKTLLAGSALFIIAPYLTFDYAGYLPLTKVPAEYRELKNYLADSGVCQKAYYPPGLGFVYFKDERAEFRDAANSDLLALALGVPRLDDGATFSFLPTAERFYRNELVSQFYEKHDQGEFASLLAEGGVDCVILRLDTESRFAQASNLWRETDPVIVKKWNQTDLLALVRSKEGLVETKRFGENIHIFKFQNPNNKSQINSNDRITKIGNSARGQWGNKAIKQLPITEWARGFAYYEDGWSRGRYDFWRKHLFTQLRQDFIYTDKPESVLSGKATESGSYELWIRHLVGGSSGSFQFSVFRPAGDHPKGDKFQVDKDVGVEKFVWRKLGDIDIKADDEIKIINVAGENAIADIVFVSKTAPLRQGSEEQASKQDSK
ncbi:MAG: hypothetical protein AAB360_00065 [Patescibacteria group bacterium]